MRLRTPAVILAACLAFPTLASAIGFSPIVSLNAHVVMLEGSADQWTAIVFNSGTELAPNAAVRFVVSGPECGSFGGVPGAMTADVVADAQANAVAPPFVAGPSMAHCTMHATRPEYSQTSYNILDLFVIAPSDVSVSAALPMGGYFPLSLRDTNYSVGATFTIPAFGQGVYGEHVHIDFPAGCGGPPSFYDQGDTNFAGTISVPAYVPSVEGDCALTATLTRLGITLPLADVVTYDPAGVRVEPGEISIRPGDSVTIDAFVKTGNGIPFRSVPVSWQALGTPGGVGPTSFTAPNSTGPSGDMPLQLTGNAAEGTYSLSVTMSGITRTIRVNQGSASMVSQATRLDIASGDGQVAAIGTVLPQPLQVRLRDSNGQPLAGAPVEFVLDASGPAGAFTGSVGASAFAMTDANGLAQVGFTPTIGVGQGTVYARVYDTASQAYVSVALHFTSTFANGASTADFQDIWWNPAQSGWGFAIAQSNAKLFEVLYTYDAAGQPTWFAATDATWTTGFGSTSVGNLYAPTSSPYYAYDAARFNAGAPPTNLSVAFADPQRAQLTTSVLDGGVARSLQRYVFADRSAVARGVGGMWWGGPAQNGWGLSIFEQGNALFVAWFTYDAAGKPLWFSMSEGNWTGNTWSGPVFKSIRGAAGQVATTSVGTFSIAFTGTGTGSFHFDVEGHQGTVAVQRFLF